MRKSILLMVAVITAAVVMASGNQATAHTATEKAQDDLLLQATSYRMIGTVDLKGWSGRHKPHVLKALMLSNDNMAARVTIYCTRGGAVVFISPMYGAMLFHLHRRKPTETPDCTPKAELPTGRHDSVLEAELPTLPKALEHVPAMDILGGVYGISRQQNGSNDPYQHSR